MQKKFDVIIIGRGIVGLATAMALLRRAPNSKIAILEKEKELAFHQTGHNSGVIHSGVYYKPGSLKARNCVAGNSKIIEFCRRHDIAVDICGKLIVATNEPEVVSLHKLWHRGRENGVENLTLVDSGGIRKIEPNCTGIAALHVKSAGITDYRAISLKMADLIQAQGGTILTDEEVKSVDIRPDIVVLKTARREIQGSIIINCAGLFSDRVARMCGTKSHARIVPFRGEYYKLRKERTELIRNLIYPVPDSRFPFLGVHFTRHIDGTVTAGPNAVLAFKREGYRKTDVNLKDLAEVASFPGFWRLASKYWSYGLSEMYRSCSKGAAMKQLQKLVPDLKESDIERAGSGVRAQAVFSDGCLADDFVIETHGRVIHVLNVPSPAATASIIIGQQIADLIGENI